MAPMQMHAHYMGLSGPALRVAVGAVAGLCFIAFGYGQGDVGGLVIERTFVDHFPVFDYARDSANLLQNSTLAGTVIAVWNIGCILGAFLTIFLSDRLGRKGNIILGLVLETIGKIIQCSSFGIGQYVAGRLIAGTGNGFITSTIPAWQAECLKTHRRGTLLLVSFGTCITAGLAIAYWFVYAFSFVQPSSASWRVPIILATLFTLPALALVCFMPDSPRWLLLKGREQEAIRALSALNELPEGHEDIRREILQIKYAVKHMASEPAGQVFTNGEYRYLHRTLLAVLLQIMQQFTGINLFMQYLGVMFLNELQFPAKQALLLAACCATWFCLASLVAVFVVDKLWGRRDLTCFGASGMCLCMIMLCIFNYLGIFEQKDWAFSVMAAALFVYLTFFSIGWQGMSWMWSVELVPLSIRGPANALSTAANWLSNFIVVIVTPVMFTNIGYQTYIVFAVCNAVIVPTIYFLYPETGARSLEEVDMVFRSAHNRGNPWFSVVTAAKQEPKWFDKNGDPTDSYGGSESGELEKGSDNSTGEHSSPDPLWRNANIPPSPRMSEDAFETVNSAPAPAIRRTHSNDRAASRNGRPF
ncbi:hypothetical protein LTR37_014529 [Vermiconidia calcicola]|uniref:Uncharacterized protein n=1 Tax=Vermiconidia calcicola TaxID=1690605 RepID=A0ACC3MTE3_9PEZI|nr:hypothetical protein LTR37_014529 [Vermiconidia calcicola]